MQKEWTNWYIFKQYNTNTIQVASCKLNLFPFLVTSSAFCFWIVIVRSGSLLLCIHIFSVFAQNLYSVLIAYFPKSSDTNMIKASQYCISIHYLFILVVQILQDMSLNHKSKKCTVLAWFCIYNLKRWRTPQAQQMYLLCYKITFWKL